MPKPKPKPKPRKLKQKKPKPKKTSFHGITSERGSFWLFLGEGWDGQYRMGSVSGPPGRARCGHTSCNKTATLCSATAQAA